MGAERLAVARGNRFVTLLHGRSLRRRRRHPARRPPAQIPENRQAGRGSSLSDVCTRALLGKTTPVTLTSARRIRARPDAPAAPPRMPRYRRAAAILAADLRNATKWPALDGLRGVAVLAVVGWHLSRFVGRDLGVTKNHVPMAWWPLGIGRLGVDIFFVLSGLLVVRSWTSMRRGTPHLGGALVEFARRRAGRILPAYWLSLVVLVPLVGAQLMHEPRRLALFATLNSYVQYRLPGRVNMVYWSLTTEWHFYVLVPLVAWLMLRFGRWPVLVG
jgi:hypothetical protein